jgi:4-carboxymuconolactone decarboxylase
MHPTKPRIDFLPPEQFTDEQAELAGGREGSRAQLNIVRTLVQHPALYRAWMPFAMHSIGASSIGPREREIIILHTCAVCRATYDLGQHTVIARRVGLTPAEIEAAKTDGAGLSEFERTLMRGVEELVENQGLSDETWAAISQRYSRQQQLDFVFTVGNYTMMSMTTNTFGVPLEDDLEGGWKPV